MKVTIQITPQEQQLCFTRIINTILDHLPENYYHLDDVLELREVMDKLDQATRSAANKKE